MAVGSNGIGPLTHSLLLSGGVGPDGLVVVEEVGQVVLDEVFTRHTEVHRIPVGELTTQFPIVISECKL